MPFVCFDALRVAKDAGMVALRAETDALLERFDSLEQIVEPLVTTGGESTK